METSNSKLDIVKSFHKLINIITNKGLKYLTLHVMSLYNILVELMK